MCLFDSHGSCMCGSASFVNDLLPTVLFPCDGSNFTTPQQPLLHPWFALFSMHQHFQWPSLCICSALEKETICMHLNRYFPSCRCSALAQFLHTCISFNTSLKIFLSWLWFKLGLIFVLEPARCDYLKSMILGRVFRPGDYLKSMILMMLSWLCL